MDGRKILLIIIIAVAGYFFFKNFDFQTMTLKTSDELIKYEGGTTQQSELHEAAKHFNEMAVFLSLNKH